MKFFFLALTTLVFQQAQAVEYPVKNFLQIPYSLESSTGVSQKTPEILNYYNNQKGKFPQKGEMIEISVPGVLSQLSYGSLFCQKLVSNDSKLAPAGRWVHKEVDFTKKASTWSDSLYVSIFREYAEIFWQRSIETDELNILAEESKLLRATYPDTTEAVQPFLTSLCSVFAGSFSFLIL